MAKLTVRHKEYTDLRDAIDHAKFSKACIMQNHLGNDREEAREGFEQSVGELLVLLLTAIDISVGDNEGKDFLLFAKKVFNMMEEEK